VIVPNFAKIGGTVPEIWPIFDFQDVGRPPSWIFKKLKILTSGPVRFNFRPNCKQRLKTNQEVMFS